ncbi:MAG: hypothetical protein WCQ55_03305 [Paludibacteraceae bacterium]|nr:hypothetical protein [Prevotellaceae bacterium]
MANIQKIAEFVLSTFLLIMGMSLYGQNDLRFSYECKDKTLSPFNTKVLLKSPDKEIFNLFADTASKFVLSEKEYFKSTGIYTLFITYSTEGHGQDSIAYDFDICGTEINTNISIEFDYKERLIKQGDIFIKGEKVINGYIRVNKYYDAPKSIDIALDNKYLGNEYYKGPFFKVKNNSKDTLYGEYLPGYFWGTLSYRRNDSTLFTRYGSIDCMFVDSSPLYPDSIKHATVGSFGLTKKLLPFEYRFEVMLADKWQSYGIGVYKESKHVVWAGTKKYYKLKCDFKIDE